MFLEIMVAGAIAATSNNWQFSDDVVDGSRHCAVTQSFADGTTVLFAVSEENAKLRQFAFMAENKAWSISTGEELGDITLTADNYHFGSQAVAGPSLFVIGSSLRGLVPFLRSASASKFTIILSDRNREIGPYATAGLTSAVDKLEACIARQFNPERDPFVK